MAFKKLKLWFDKDLAIRLADKIAKQDPSFQKEQFVLSVEQRIETLELKGRVECMADELHSGFFKKYQKGISTLLEILGPENQKESGMFTAYYWLMPIAKYVEKFGLNDFDLSMQAIEEITKRNTGEYAIRPYIKEHFEKTMDQMLKWSLNPNKHVRRLSSEGLRPRLPWARKLDVFINDPMPIVLILNNLKDDESRYVQKSVGNCLNDILKDNYLIGQEVIERWNSEDCGSARKWIIKHALRNLLKQNNAWAKEMIQ